MSGASHVGTAIDIFAVMNNKYKITIKPPLLRAGMKIETECSERYVVDVTTMLMNLVRKINAPYEPVKGKVE